LLLPHMVLVDLTRMNPMKQIERSIQVREEIEEEANNFWRQQEEATDFWREANNFWETQQEEEDGLVTQQDEEVGLELVK
jgi:hypothetical protein